MSLSTDLRSDPEPPSGQPPSEATLQRLGQAIAHVGGDSEYLADALADFLFVQRPFVPNALAQHDANYLVESGAFTPDELADAMRIVERGSLQLGAALNFLSNLHATRSLGDIMGFLNLASEAVTQAVQGGRLYAVVISGQVRFPDWQFSLESPGRLLPHLPEVIEALAGWDARSISGFMATPQSGLVAEGRQTPVEWLRRGLDVTAIRKIVEEREWR
ncbi:hypothetical protein [Microbacterium murale]|uniref:AraC family transcriptional regulator n=1 Tax=Microbacterium murale TaxID=1081040 RepID=A0ABQ1RRS9_9MICO|nr:hypothetical protein [Microbacterium murale]GGD76624.1 hypothetical protein GCM10007269_19470 [Microbacterium murale]